MGSSRTLVVVLVALGSTSSALACDDLYRREAKAICMAQVEADSSGCNTISHTYAKLECKALARQSVSACSSARSADAKLACEAVVEHVAKGMSSYNDCQKVSDSDLQSWCTARTRERDQECRSIKDLLLRNLCEDLSEYTPKTPPKATEASASSARSAYSDTIKLIEDQYELIESYKREARATAATLAEGQGRIVDDVGVVTEAAVDFRAEYPELDQETAIKMIRSGGLGTEAQQAQARIDAFTETYQAGDKKLDQLHATVKTQRERIRTMIEGELREQLREANADESGVLSRLRAAHRDQEADTQEFLRDFDPKNKER